MKIFSASKSTPRRNLSQRLSRGQQGRQQWESFITDKSALRLEHEHDQQQALKGSNVILPWLKYRLLTKAGEIRTHGIQLLLVIAASGLFMAVASLVNLPDFYLEADYSLVRMAGNPAALFFVTTALAFATVSLLALLEPIRDYRAWKTSRLVASAAGSDEKS